MRKALVLSICALLCGCGSHTQKPSTAQSPATIKPIKAPILDTPPQYDHGIYANYILSVVIEGGKIDFHNIDAYAAFKPVQFTLTDGETKSIEIEKSGDNFFRSKTSLTVEYDDGILSLDVAPNPYEMRRDTGSARDLHFNSRWLRGLRYDHINTQGEASLDEVSVTVLLAPQGN